MDATEPKRQKADSGAVVTEEQAAEFAAKALTEGKPRLRILTGDRTTGKLHIGHYVGSLKHRVKYQSLYDTFILMADVQALTTHYDRPEILKQSVREVALDYMAVGIDPGQATICVQSMIPAIAELTVYFGLLVPVRSLIDNPTTKAEAEQYGFSVDPESESLTGFGTSETDVVMRLIWPYLEQHFPELGEIDFFDLKRACDKLMVTHNESRSKEFKTTFDRLLHGLVLPLRSLVPEWKVSGSATGDRDFQLLSQMSTYLTSIPYYWQSLVIWNFEEFLAEQYPIEEEDNLYILDFLRSHIEDPNTDYVDTEVLDLHVYAHAPTIMKELRELLIRHKRLRGFSSLPYGFLGYPVSQAADITFVGAHLVPVGPDQVPLIELCREVVHRFNAQYGKKKRVLTSPYALLGVREALQGIDGNAKMSKSLNNAIYLSETDAEIWAKVKVAPTDPQRVRREDPGRPEVCNIFSYHKVFNRDKEAGIDEQALNVASVDEVAENCRGAKWGCVECKQQLCKKLGAILDPMRERRASWEKRPDDLEDVLRQGNARANEEGQKTLEKVRAAMHMDYFAK